MTRKSLEHLSITQVPQLDLSELLLASVCPSGLKAIDLHDQKRFGGSPVRRFHSLIIRTAASKGLPIGANLAMA